VIVAAAITGMAGGALAALTTSVAFEGLIRQVPRAAYGQARVGVDLRVAAFAVSLGLLAGLVFAVIPAWRATRQDVQAVIQRRPRGVTGGRRWLGRPMIGVQVALAIVLVSGAIVAGRAFVSVLRVPLGFVPEHVLTVRMLPRGVSGLALRSFYAQAVDRLAALPDVVAAGATGSLPLSGEAPFEPILIGPTETGAALAHVMPGYFETAGILLRSGRALERSDVVSGEPVAVVSQSAARLLFDDRDPLGATFDTRTGPRYTVVGVVGDALQSLDRDYRPLAYVVPQDDTSVMTLVLRTRTRHERTLLEIKRELSRLAPGVPVTASWWSDSIDALAAYLTPRFQTLVLGSFAALALGLTALCVFGLVAFLVATRTHEMGVRLAIGATPGDLVRFVVGEALAPVGAGLVVGVVAAFLAGRVTAARLHGIDVRDPLALAAAALTVVVAALMFTRRKV